MAQCPSCGSGVEVVPGRCRKCGTSVAAPASAAVAAAGTGQSQDGLDQLYFAAKRTIGAAVGAGSAAAAAPALMQRSAPPSFAGLSDYYQREFSKIYNSNQTYKGRFNWAAFFFGPLWALSKGLVLNGVIAIAAILLTGGVLGLPISVLYGARGNYFYYANFVHGKQLAF